MMVEHGTSVPKAETSQFELLKVLGQGSFGKVSCGCVRECMSCEKISTSLSAGVSCAEDWWAGCGENVCNEGVKEGFFKRSVRLPSFNT